MAGYQCKAKRCTCMCACSWQERHVLLSCCCGCDEHLLWHGVVRLLPAV